MAKMSDWKIIATEGATIDGRNISKNWITEMADAYSQDEYTALIWPEHDRSNWSQYNGNNWGIVEQLKAEESNGKLRLFAKITPNEYLLTANAKGQKIFASIEPEPDYKGQGTCYLTGLAVTDSPASSGTTRLKFSKSNGEEISQELSQLEELDFSECRQSDHSLIANAFTTIAKFFQSGGQLPDAETKPTTTNEEEPMNAEQFAKIETTLESIVNTQKEQKTKLDALETQFSKKPEEETPEEQESNKFSAELKSQFETISESIKALDTKFNELKQEVPGQENQGEGNGNSVEAL